MNDTPLTEAERERIVAVFARVPFVHHLGLELVEVERGTSTVAAEVRTDHLQNQGLLHGGFTASLIDTATAFAIISQLNEGESTNTVDLMIHYLRPMLAGRIAARAKVVRAGRRIVTATAEVFDAGGKLCSMASTTYIRLGGKAP
jgi:uncharacterized protein (TIGR00369 family)